MLSFRGCDRIGNIGVSFRRSTFTLVTRDSTPSSSGVIRVSCRARIIKFPQRLELLPARGIEEVLRLILGRSVMRRCASAFVNGFWIAFAAATKVIWLPTPENAKS